MALQPGPQGEQGERGEQGPRGRSGFIGAVVLVVIGMVIAATFITSRGRGAPPAALVAVPAPGACGLSAPAFCETFDSPFPMQGRSGQLDPLLWGVSRADGNLNFGTYQSIPANHNPCAGGALTPPDRDVYICNGRAVETISAAGVDVLAMYPRQPFDFAGRTGRIAFDVSNDNKGSHSFWPELWLTDQPIPAPSVHLTFFQSNPRNGFGIKFMQDCPANSGCAPCPAASFDRGTVESAVIVRNYVAQDTEDGLNGPQFFVNGLDCVRLANGIGQMNHYEVTVSQSQIDVYGTDAVNVGSPFGPLKHIAVIANANLTFTRGLVWLTHNTYDADKFGQSDDHSFAWDNLGFDGPQLYRDVTYDEPDSAIDNGNGTFTLSYDYNTAPHVVTFDVNATYLSNATSTLVMANFVIFNGSTPVLKVNGTTVNYTFPYPKNFGINTLAIPIDKALLHSGPNTISFQAPEPDIHNVTLLLVAAIPAGGTPQPTAIPTATTPPGATATPVPPTATGVPPTATVPPGVTPTVGPTPQTYRCQVQQAKGGFTTVWTKVGGGSCP